MKPIANLREESATLREISNCLEHISQQLARLAEILSTKDAAFAAGMVVSAAWSIEATAAVVSRHCEALNEAAERN